MNLENKKVLVTGGKGFLGNVLVPKLKEKGAEVFTFSSKDYDLRKEKSVERLFDKVNPSIVLHLAVDCGGFKYKKDNPGSMFYNNIMMDALVQEQSRLKGVEKFVGIGTVCSYPQFAKSPLKEDTLSEGCPEDFNCSYGLAKRMMMIQSQAYRKQYEFNAIHLLPVNLYGPNYDFNIPTTIKVIPIFIEKILRAKKDGEKILELNGTPNASREFLYVEDCSEGILMATEKYDKPEPVNIGYGKQITMRDLAEKIKGVVDFKGKIIWNEEISNEEPGRVLDTSRAEKEFGFRAKTSLEEGLKKTIGWHLENYKNI